MPNLLFVSIPMTFFNEFGHYLNMDSLYPEEMGLSDKHQADYERMFQVLKKSTTLADVYSSLFGSEPVARTAEETRLHEQAVRYLLCQPAFEGCN